ALVGLERVGKIVGVLAGQYGIGGQGGRLAIGTVTGGAGVLLERFLASGQVGGVRGRASNGEQASRYGESQFIHVGSRLLEAGIVGGDIGHVLRAEGLGDGFHGGEGAVAAGVLLQGGHDVFGVLAGDHGNVVNLGEAGLVSFDAVAADAH